MALNNGQAQGKTGLTRGGKRAIWRQRGRRTVGGLHAWISILLALTLLVLLNFMAYRHLRFRRDISSLRYYVLADKTRSMLNAISGEVRITTLFRQDAGMLDEIKRLLQEYEYAAAPVESLTLVIEHVDPDRDLVRTGQLSDDYDVTEANVVIFASGGRHKVVDSKTFVEYERLVDDSSAQEGLLLVRNEKRAFRGEQIISSAIHSLVEERSPVIYFLGGHGERQTAEFSKGSGYGSLVRVMRRDNIDVRTLLLAAEGAIPEDCDALVVAGPDRRLARSELDVISGYLNRNGRVLFLLDPATTTGLDGLLADWGVKLARDVVVGLTLTGRELFIKDYGGHPVTRGLKGVVTTFYMPRSVEPAEALSGTEDVPADKPKVTILAATSKGWAEMNLNQDPPRFDADVDRKGPVSVAVAVERGPVSDIDVELKPTRMVVVGDSDFVSNGAMKAGVGGNTDFFLSAVNWLLEREALMAIAPKAPIDLRLDMDERQAKTAFALIVVAVPLVIAALGVLVWVRRRV